MGIWGVDRETGCKIQVSMEAIIYLSHWSKLKELNTALTFCFWRIIYTPQGPPRGFSHMHTSSRRFLFTVGKEEVHTYTKTSQCTVRRSFPCYLSLSWEMPLLKARLCARYRNLFVRVPPAKNRRKKDAWWKASWMASQNSFFLLLGYFLLCLLYVCCFNHGAI